jgi:hypothetical protein
MGLRGFGFSLDIQAGTTRSWYLDSMGVKRWVYDDTIVDNQNTDKSVSMPQSTINTNEKE